MSRGTRDREARSILARHREHGFPYVLLLRNYHKIHSLRPINLQQSVHEKLSPSFGVLSIRGELDWHEADEAQPGPTHNASPAFMTTDEDWRDLVVELIAGAAFILVDMALDSAGVSFEVRKCIELERAEDTILVLAAPKVSQISDLSALNSFWRVVLGGDMVRAFSLFNHPASRDLFRGAFAARGDGSEKEVDRAYGGGWTPSSPIWDFAQLGVIYRDINDPTASRVHLKSAWTLGERLAARGFDNPKDVEAYLAAGIGVSEWMLAVGRSARAIEITERLVEHATGSELGFYRPRIIEIHDLAVRAAGRPS